MLMYTGLKVGC